MNTSMGSSKEIHKQIPEKEGQQRVEESQQETAPERECACPASPVCVAFPESLRYHTGSTDSEQVGNGAEEHERWHADCNCSDLRVVVRESNEERISHIVDDEYNLPHDCWNRKLKHCVYNGGVFKQILFCDSHSCTPYSDDSFI